MRGSVLKRCPVCARYGKAVCKAQGGCKDPVYYIAYRVNGRQKRETIGPNKKLAEKVLAQRLASIIMGEYGDVQDISFDAFADKWLDEHARVRTKPQTFYNYKNTIKHHLRPFFKGSKVSKINSGDIRSLIARVLKERTAKTANNILVLMKTMFKHARKWGYIKNNPTEDIEKFKEEHQEMDFLNPQEISLLLKHAQEPYKTLFLLAILTGMRRSEIMALQWGDIDWNSNTIFVRRSLYWIVNEKKGPNWRFITPKSKRSIRAIVMSPMLKKALQIHQITCPVNEHDLVFSNKVGNPLDGQHVVNRYFLPTLRMAGLRKIRFHDLRHSFTSLLIAQGENTKFIQSQLGHASIQTTLDRYGHLFPVDQAGVGGRLDAQIFNENALERVDNLKAEFNDKQDLQMQVVVNH